MKKEVPLVKSVVLSVLSCLATASVAGAVHADDAVSIPVTYTLPRDAQVSVNIYNAKGQIVRELLHADKRKKGENTESWDGLDESGQPAAAGSYSWKLLSTQGLTAEYITTLGTNPNPRWDTWPANHNGLTTVAADASGVYMGGPGEGSILMLKQTLADAPADEKRLWKIDGWLEAWQGPSAMAVAGDRLYHLQGNGKMQVMDAATGKVLVTWPAVYTADEMKAVTHWLGLSTVYDIAARGETVVASEKLHNAVRWLDPQTGKSVDEAAIPDPTGIAAGAGGAVYVISRGAVYTLSRENKTPRLVVEPGELHGAWRVDIDPKTGDILVAETAMFGESTQQVKRFSADGKLLKAYGLKGGRPPEGLYDPAGFANINDLTALPDGGFIATEPWTAPRRTVRYNAAGVITREWYGGQMYANFADADPADPTLVWLDSNWGSLIQAKVDYLAKTWKVNAVYSYQGLLNGLIGGPSHGGGRWRVMHHGTDTLLALEGNPTLVRVDEKNRRLVPLVVTGVNIVVPWNPDPWGGKPQWFRDLLGNDKNTPMRSYLWADKNGDGKLQNDEIAFSKWSTWGGGWTIDKDLNYYYCGDVWEQNKFKEKVVYKVAVKGWSKDGVPDYTGWEDSPVAAHVPPEFKAIGGTSLATAADGTLIGAFNTELGGGGGKAFGQGWWSARVGGNKVVRWGKDGKALWYAGRHAPASIPLPGEAGHFWRLMGMVRGCLAVTDVEASRVHVWDGDGLWVGRFFDNPDLKAAPIEAYTLSGENFGGSVYENPKTGNVIFYGGGQNNNPVYRIRGWEDFERQKGAFEVSPEVASKIKVRTEFEATRDDVLRIPALVNGYKTDGELTEWKDIKPIEIKDGPATVAKFWAGFNNNNFVAAWDVTTDTPWKNASPDQLAFRGGASVALNIGLWDPARKAPAPGDMRLVVAPIAGKAKVLLYMPVVPLDAQHTRRDNGPIYETGNGKLQLQRFESRGEVMVKPKIDDTGYVVEIRVPNWWLLLPFHPGQKLRFDASVGLSNPQGNKTETRLNWHSKDATDMATDDVFYEGMLHPQNWGEARIE